jgi:succinate dehydrogenase / fumarate reductase cytochrome b subunit
MGAFLHRHHYVLKRLHSLSGLIPVGVFLMFHLFINSTATVSREAYDRAAGFLEGLPFLIWIELAIIVVPILYHGLYGILCIWESDYDAWRYKYARGWLFWLQRVTGAMAFIFIGVHVWHTRIASMIDKASHPVDFTMMQGIMHSHFFVWFYVIGLAACVFHFSNGLWNLGFKWGVSVNVTAQRWSLVVCSLVGLAFFLVGLTTLIVFIKAAGAEQPIFGALSPFMK